MLAAARARRRPTDDWQQLRLLVTSPEQATYELLRPRVLFGHPIRARAHETGVPERTLRRKAARFASAGMRNLFEVADLAASDRRLLPFGIRKAIVELKAEYPPLSLRQIATICEHRFDRPVSHRTVKQVLATEPLPLHPPRRLPRYRDIPDPVARRKAIVDLFAEGWRPTAIAGYLETTRTCVYESLARSAAEGWPGLADRPRGAWEPARKVDLRAMAAIRRLQADPELGEIRVHAALAQQGIHLSPRTCGRILALHRQLYGLRKPDRAPRETQPMPFAAVRRHQFWSVDIRYIEDHQLGTGKPVYAISILENFSRALLASAISPRQDLTAFLIVLREAIAAHGAPEALVSDGGGVFRANQAKAIYAALGVEHRPIARGQAWQNYVETQFNIMRRMADYHYARRDVGRPAGGPRPLLPRLQPPAARRPQRAPQRAAESRRGVRLGPRAWCDPADLNQLFRLRATRLLNPGGYVRFRHWRLYGERGLAGERAAVWVDGETLTLESATETLAQYRVAVAADGRRLEEVDEPRLYATGHASPQPFLPELEGLDWRLVQRLVPYRARRQRRGEGRQERLVVPEPDAVTG